MFIEFSKNHQHEQIDHDILDQHHIDYKKYTVNDIFLHTIVHYQMPIFTSRHPKHHDIRFSKITEIHIIIIQHSTISDMFELSAGQNCKYKENQEHQSEHI